MGRRLSIAVFCSLMVLAPLAVASPAGAAKPKVTATGQVTCRMAGKVKYAPALTPAAKSVTASFKATLTCSTGTTGNAAVRVTGGKLTGASTPYSGSCSRANPATLRATIKWKATGGKVNPTTVVLGGTTGGPNPIRHSFGSGSVTGSYAGERPTATFTSAVTPSACAAAKKGTKGWSFAGAPFEITNVVCDGRIGTEPGSAVAPNGAVWLVVVTDQPYVAACHPRGTITATFFNAFCGTYTNVPITSSGATVAQTPTGPVSNPSPFWGINLGAGASEGGGCAIDEASYSPTDDLHIGFSV